MCLGYPRTLHVVGLLTRLAGTVWRPFLALLLVDRERASQSRTVVLSKALEKGATARIFLLFFDVGHCTLRANSSRDQDPAFTIVAAHCDVRGSPRPEVLALVHLESFPLCFADFGERIQRHCSRRGIVESQRRALPSPGELRNADLERTECCHIPSAMK